MHQGPTKSLVAPPKPSSRGLVCCREFSTDCALQRSMLQWEALLSTIWQTPLQLRPTDYGRVPSRDSSRSPKPIVAPRMDMALAVVIMEKRSPSPSPEASRVRLGLGLSGTRRCLRGGLKTAQQATSKETGVMSRTLCPKP